MLSQVEENGEVRLGIVHIAYFLIHKYTHRMANHDSVDPIFIYRRLVLSTGPVKETLSLGSLQ